MYCSFLNYIDGGSHTLCKVWGLRRSALGSDYELLKTTEARE